MAEIFLSATIQVLIEQLSGELIDFARREGVDISVKKLKKKLLMISDVLADAEEKQITKKSVRDWLQDLRELAFDAEDVLDELATEAKRRMLKVESEASSNTKVQSFCIHSCLEPKAIKFNFTIKSKIEKITTRFQEIEEQKKGLDLLVNVNQTREIRSSPPTTSHEEFEPHYGRDEDKETIVGKLLGGTARGDGLRVISINGMGGSGKTTLARLVYNDGRVQTSFYPKAWVCVSDQEFDCIRVTKAMLNSFTEQTSDDKDLELLQKKLKEKLSKQKFLLVLDDVWPENYNIDCLFTPLIAGAPGSRIIITTRSRDFSSAMHTVLAYNLEDHELSLEDTEAIFFHHASFETRDLDERQSLKETGKKIVLERCKRSPLAAKALGGLLRNTPDQRHWENVLTSQIWDFSEDKCGILPVLRLSYHHLPLHLKPCFAYCSVYPKDYEFCQEQLVLLWMAAGLVQQCQGESMSMEDVGAEYFRDLLSRSFFQRSSVNESLFVMHDLINDLAQWVARETCFRLEDKKQHKDSKKVRHSSYIGGTYDGVDKFEAFHQFERLRTFLRMPITVPSWDYGYLTRNVPFDLLPKLRFLRVLSLGGYRNTELPESIGNLKHLRYLDLSGSEIRSLPRSTSTLYNLQTLILKDCSRLEMLPTEMGNLKDLRHLDITDADSIKEMPRQIGKLTNLQKLSNFIIGGDSGSAGIKELANLKFLSATLCISSLEKVMIDRDAFDAKIIKDKQDLDVLTLQYSDEFNASRKERVEEEVLNMLEPPKKLTELYIKYYGGTTLPTWLGNPSFSKMVVLRLENCAKCTSLPPLGQLPSLEDLCIQGMKEVKSVGIEFYGSNCAKYFPSLKTLRFENMEAWEAWVDCFPSEIDGQVKVFPCLREVCVEKCPKLSGKLPDHLPSLEKMVIRESSQLTVSISSHPEPYEIDINHRQEKVQGSVCSLKSLALSDISKISCLTEAFVQGLTKIEDLKIVDCNELSSLWQKEEGLLQHLTSLCDQLTIEYCPEFVSLGTEEEIEQQQPPMLPLSRPCCPTALRKLSIRRCPKLVVALLEKRDNSSESLLEVLSISSCNSLTSLSLPTTLKNLYVSGCPKLEFVVERFHHNTFLEEIRISFCNNLKSLPEDLHNLTRLSRLEIMCCASLVSLPDCIYNLTSLQTLKVEDCKKLEVLPRLQNLTSLQTLQIWRCEKLEVLPRLQNLTSLQGLQICHCPGIVSFPEEGFPTNLTSLEIYDLKILDSIIDWGLRRLTSLKRLEIGGPYPDLMSFPEEDDRMMLPASLTSLTITDFPNLKYLSSKADAFQNLTSLEFLTIGNCPKLKFFSKKGLPLSLLNLRIFRCPLLEQRYKRGQGRDSPEIAYIPHVKIGSDT